MPIWPTTLPQFALREGYAEGFKQTVLRSPMDSGATKRRQRFINAPTTLSITIPLTDAEILIFKAFYEDELGNGALSFTFPHPRLKTNVTVVFKTDPEPLTPEGANTYMLKMDLEVLA